MDREKKFVVFQPDSNFLRGLISNERPQSLNFSECGATLPGRMQSDALSGFTALPGFTSFRSAAGPSASAKNTRRHAMSRFEEVEIEDAHPAYCPAGLVDERKSVTDTDTTATAGGPENLAALRMAELRAIASSKGIRGISAMRKHELIEAIKSGGKSAASNAPKRTRAKKAEADGSNQVTSDNGDDHSKKDSGREKAEKNSDDKNNAEKNAERDSNSRGESRPDRGEEEMSRSQQRRNRRNRARQREQEQRENRENRDNNDNAASGGNSAGESSKKDDSNGLSLIHI